MIKLLPSPTGTRVKTTSCSHEITVSKFIKYFHSNILPSDFEEKIDFPEPTIIATGPSQLSINQFFISIECKLLPIPSHYNFYQVFDIYFKIFHIFKLQYTNNLKLFFNFIETHLYAFSTSNSCPRVFEIWTAIQTLKTRTESDFENLISAL